MMDAADLTYRLLQTFAADRHLKHEEGKARSGRGYVAKFNWDPRGDRARIIREQVPDVLPGDDFASFFASKVISVDERDRSELKDTVFVYEKDGLESLYQDLEHSFLKFGWSDVDSLGKVFLALKNAAMMAGCPYLWVCAPQLSYTYLGGGFHVGGRILGPSDPKFENLGFVFSKRYEEVGLLLDPGLDVVRTFVVSGNIGLLDEALKFGATMFKPRNSFYTWYHVSVLLMTLCDQDQSLQIITADQCSSSFKQFGPTVEQRLHIVMLALEVSVKISMKPEFSSYYKQCLRKVFCTIPEPRVRSCEVKDFLTRLLQPEAKEMIEKVTKQYEAHFPESAGLVTPRSLKHLSRVEVRHTLKEQGCFIRGMLHLDLPMTLKRYVDLDLFSSKNPTMAIRHLQYNESWEFRHTEFPMICTDEYLKDPIENGFVLR